jgi:hypothetical protein
MTEKTAVRFLKAWRGYSAGELACFDDPVVEGLESKGFAEIYKGEGEPVAKAKGGKGKSQKAGGSNTGNTSTETGTGSPAGNGTATTTETGTGPDNGTITDPDDEKP